MKRPNHHHHHYHGANQKITFELKETITIVDDRRQRVKQVLLQIFNNKKYIVMDALTLEQGSQAPILEALVDAVTLQVKPEATKVNKTRVSDSPDIATVDADGNLVSVKVGSGNVTTVNTWTYKDSKTGEMVTRDFSTTEPFQVIITPEGVLQVVTLGQQVPIPQPPATNS